MGFHILWIPYSAICYLIVVTDPIKTSRTTDPKRFCSTSIFYIMMHTGSNKSGVTFTGLRQSLIGKLQLLILVFKITRSCPGPGWCHIWFGCALIMCLESNIHRCVLPKPLHKVWSFLVPVQLLFEVVEFVVNIPLVSLSVSSCVVQSS